MSNIRQIEPKRLQTPKEIKALSEELSKMANEEALSGLAIVAVRPDGEMRLCYSSSGCFYSIIGGMEDLKSIMLEDSKDW